MLGKASDIKTHQIEVLHGAYANSGSIDRHINDWLLCNPHAQIINMQYNTYTMPDANGDMSLGESVLIIYKEAL
jgi:hypothetical protein